MSNHKHPFESWLSVSVEYLDGILENPPPLPWLEFWLNPRRLRGSDFLMRWSQGVWSEKRLIEAVNQTKEFFAIPYGPSGTAPTSSVREFELYFERLEAAGLGQIKRPDLLIFGTADKAALAQDIAGAGGLSELPFIAEDDKRMTAILKRALIAVECENSLWRGQKMPDFKTPLRPQKRLGGNPGLKKGQFCQPSSSRRKIVNRSGNGRKNAGCRFMSGMFSLIWPTDCHLIAPRNSWRKT